MKRKVTVTKRRASRLGFDQPCGCPLYEQLELKGFAVKRVEIDKWTDYCGRSHKLKPPFTLQDYAKVLTTGKPFTTETSDE